MSMIGKSLAHYSVTAEIGKGGMGEVYQATDTKLGRSVAIKVLPEEFAKDADRIARFQREAKLLASLNHPNIAAIHGLEEADYIHFLVLELVEGKTLAERIQTGPMDVEEALKLGLQIAEALEAAHDRGVIHRDLKPANIKVTPDGKVKVLDFGLAKAYAGEQDQVSLSNSPTLSDMATQQGLILGTAAYMSPEQARGKPVDKRTDVWAFGCVLYEMLTGQAAFQGEDVTEILAAVVKSGVNMDLLPSNIHLRVREVLSRCLQKDQKKRYRDIGEAQYEIERVLGDPDGVFVKPVTAVKARKKLRVGIPWVAAAVVLAVIIAGVAGWMLRPSESPKIIKFLDALKEGQQFTSTTMGDVSLAVSPDGNHVAYDTNEGLYLRSMDELNARLISNTEGNITSLSFSPDGQWICYFSEAERKIKKIAISGGAPFAICDAEWGTGTSWPKEDMIIYGDAGNIYKVSSYAGTPELLVEGGSMPQLLPDGNTVLFTDLKVVQPSGKITVQSLESDERKPLFDGEWAYYLPTKHIIYELENNIYAVPFDLDRLEATGGSASLVEEVNQFAVSNSGTLAYVHGDISNSQSQLQWFDRQENQLESVGEPSLYSQFSLSPDGKKIIIEKGPTGRKDLYLIELDRNGAGFPIVSDLSSGAGPIWSPDGNYIAFRSGNKIFRKSLAEETEPELLLELKDNATPITEDWSNNGRFIFYKEISTKGNDLRKLPLFDDKTPVTVVQGPDTYDEPKFSPPDDKWMAYMSDETGRWEVYIRPLDREGERRIISTQGGAQPKWRGDGKELFYLALDGTMMAVELEGEQLEPGVPQPLFQTGITVTPVQDQYAVTQDGQRFIILTSEQATGGPTLNIILNWFEELKERVPVD